MEFKVGDRVVIEADPVFPNFPYGVGTVCGFLGSQSIGVELDEGHILAHTCIGRCQDYKGWWFNKDRVKPWEG